MKIIYYSLGLTLVGLNTIWGLVLNSYELQHWLLANAVIIVNVVLLLILYYSKNSDGFKVALNFLLPFLGTIAFALIIILGDVLKNGVLFGLQIGILFIQTSLLIITNFLMKKPL
jgi:hypothetical protein